MRTTNIYEWREYFLNRVTKTMYFIINLMMILVWCIDVSIFITNFKLFDSL
jgi:hypothetical protein